MPNINIPKNCFIEKNPVLRISSSNHSIIELGRYATVCKFHDFSVTQILREINFWESRRSKNVVFAIYRVLNFVNLVNCSLSKSAKIHKIQNSEPPNVLKWQILHFQNPLNWFHVKSEWQKNPEISTLWILDNYRWLGTPYQNVSFWERSFKKELFNNRRYSVHVFNASIEREGRGAAL